MKPKPSCQFCPTFENNNFLLYIDNFNLYRVAKSYTFHYPPAEDGLRFRMPSKKLEVPSFYGKKEEGQFQLKRWKSKELVDSRKHIAHEYATKPWLLSFFKGVFSLQIQKPVQTILDVGCGTGFFTRFISHDIVRLKEDAIVVGSDLNRHLLTVAKKQSAHEKNHIEFVQSSAYNLPFRADKFDLVACRTLLMWLSSPLTGLREMSRVTRPGGYVACEEPDWGMTGYYDPSDLQFTKLEQKIGAAGIRGREIAYGHTPAIGRRLPQLFHDAGLRRIVLEGMFHSIRVPSDRRIKSSQLRKDFTDLLKYHSQKDNLEQYKKAVLAGGISSEEFENYMDVWRRRTRREIMALRKSVKAKENDKSFYAIPFFLAIGKKIAPN